MAGGTLARAASAGHRVVIVVATDGTTGDTSRTEPVRLAELRASAAALGVARVVHLGNSDSGNGGDLRADPHQAAERLATILREEHTDLLLSYDANGGHGHRDHLRVHEVGRLAASLAGVGQMLEATLPSDLVARTLTLVDRLRIPIRHDSVAPTAFSPRGAITHRVDVRRFARQKPCALTAHRSRPTA